MKLPEERSHLLFLTRNTIEPDCRPISLVHFSCNDSDVL